MLYLPVAVDQAALPVLPHLIAAPAFALAVYVIASGLLSPRLTVDSALKISSPFSTAAKPPTSALLPGAHNSPATTTLPPRKPMPKAPLPSSSGSVEDVVLSFMTLPLLAKVSNAAGLFT